MDGTDQVIKEMELKDMEIHSSIEFTEGKSKITVIRVLNGWIYHFPVYNGVNRTVNSVFVPEKYKS